MENNWWKFGNAKFEWKWKCLKKSIFYHLKLGLEFAFRAMISGAERSNSLVDLLAETLEAVHNQYVFALHHLASNIGKKLDVPHENLEPSPSLTSILALLRELISCHEFQHGSADDMTVLVSAVLEPLLRMCNESASHVSPNTRTVTAVYLLNCLSLIKCALFPVDTHGSSCCDLLDQQVWVCFFLWSIFRFHSRKFFSPDKFNWKNQFNSTEKIDLIGRIDLTEKNDSNEKIDLVEKIDLIEKIDLVEKIDLIWKNWFDWKNWSDLLMSRIDFCCFFRQSNAHIDVLVSDTSNGIISRRQNETPAGCPTVSGKWREYIDLLSDVRSGGFWQNAVRFMAAVKMAVLTVIFPQPVAAHCAGWLWCGAVSGKSGW